MNKQTLAQEIYQISNIKGEFTLRSGQQATEYFDKYLFEAQPNLLFEIAYQLIPYLKGEKEFVIGNSIEFFKRLVSIL